MAVKKAASSTRTRTAAKKVAAGKKVVAGKKAPAAKKAPPAKQPAAAKKAPPAKQVPAPKKAPPAKRPAAARKAAPAKKAAATPSVTKRANSKAFDAKFLAAQRSVLLAARADLTSRADDLQAEAFALTENREPGDVQFDEESGEGDTVAVERERDLVLSARARADIEEIDGALARLDNGTYGMCRVSGEPIPRERLEAIPWATERVEYKVGGFGRP